MSVRSDSAANTVSTLRPAGEVVSAQGSDSERKPVSASLINSAMSSRSWIERAKPIIVTCPTRDAARAYHRTLNFAIYAREKHNPLSAKCDELRAVEHIQCWGRGSPRK